MKLIIDIPKGTYEAVRVGTINQVLEYKVWNAIKNGTPLDDVKAEIEDLDRFYDNDYFSGNRDPMFKCNEVMQILDSIGKEKTNAD